MATYTHQSLDPNWQKAQEARLAEHRKQGLAGGFDKDKTAAERKTTAATVKSKGDAFLTNTYTGHTPESRAAMEMKQASLRQPEQAPVQEAQQMDLDLSDGTPTAPTQSTQTGQTTEGYTPNVLSETSGTVERDFNREQSALKRLGLDMNSIMNMDPKKLFEATYTEQELAGLEDYQRILGYENAKNTMDATPAPNNTMLAGLEDALRAKNNPAQQTLGVSELYKDAGIATEGVSGYTTLMQSMNNQGNIMNDRYDSFMNQLTGTAGAMKDTYNAVADKYKLHLDEYNRVADQYDRVVQNVMETEAAMELSIRQNQLDKDAIAYANAHPSPETIADLYSQGWEWDGKEFINTGGGSGVIDKSVKEDYPEGSWGGQCGTWAHSLASFPRVGNTYGTKMNAINAARNDGKAQLAGEWTPQVGDVVITDASDLTASGQPLNTGHVAVVAEVDMANRRVRYAESNRRGGEKITYDRWVSIDDPSIYGAFKDGINDKYSPGVGAAFATGDPKKGTAGYMATAELKAMTDPRNYLTQGVGALSSMYNTSTAGRVDEEQRQENMTIGDLKWEWEKEFHDTPTGAEEKMLEQHGYDYIKERLSGSVEEEADEGSERVSLEDIFG